MEFEVGTLQVVAGIGALLAGLVVGLLIGRLRSAGRRRLAALERELREARDRHTAYADSVAKHFSQTAELVRELTHQYTSLYAHLAEGSRDLCAERAPGIARGFEGALLAPGARAVEAAPAQADASSGAAEPPETAWPGDPDAPSAPGEPTGSAEPLAEAHPPRERLD